MKKALALILSVLMLLTFFPVKVITQAEAASTKPFYFVNFDRTFDASDYQYVNWMPYTWINTQKFDANSTQIDIGVYFNDYSTFNLQDAVAELYDEFKNRPAGTRHISFNAMKTVFEHCVKDAVDMEDGVRLVKDWLSRFLDAYKAMGGELDGISIELEYNFAYNFYIESVHYNNADTTKRNRNIYNDIVANKVYQERIRPKLVEYEKAGLWRFYENPDPAKYPYRSEIWTIYRYDKDGGDATCRTTWNQIIQSLLVEYINEATYEPLIARYPNAVLSDYQTGDLDASQKYVNHMGTLIEYSTVKAGNYSNFVSYNYTPDYRYYGYASATDRTKRTKYQTPYGYNGAVFGDNAYDRALWGINNHKRMMNSAEDSKMNVWVTFYNYGDKTGYGNTPYFSEVYYHLGMTDPDPFYGYILPRDLPLEAPENATDNDLSYDYHLRIADELMAELTRVAGFSDRKPIITPITWNEGFILSGMYAGGRNIWRITPDTDKVPLEKFKVRHATPAFTVGDVTITFPKGRIIEDSEITHLGSCGYWIETPADATPVVISSADRYKNAPSFYDGFDYAAGAFTANSVLPDTYWTVSGSATIDKGEGMSWLVLSGDASVTNTKVPEQITAGDYYAKQQAWEITVDLSSSIGDYGDVILLSAGGSDGGVKISGGKVYYDVNGTYKEINGVTLGPGRYTIRRELDFRKEGAYTCCYVIWNTIFDKAIAIVDNVPVKIQKTPVTEITTSVRGASSAVAFDDYKLYPLGVTTDLDLYDAVLGRALTDPAEVQTQDVGYRLSWMNASARNRVARIYNAKTGETIQTVDMIPGMDGIITGVVPGSAENPVQLAVEVGEKVVTYPETPPATEDKKEEDDTIYEGIIETLPDTDMPGEDDSDSESDVGGADAPDDTDVQRSSINKKWLYILAISFVVVIAGEFLYVFVIKPKNLAKNTGEKPEE